MNDYGDFEWDRTWEQFNGGQGMVSTPYVLWSLYYDCDLIGPILERLDSDPKAAAEALCLTSDWEKAREAKRSGPIESQKTK